MTSRSSLLIDHIKVLGSKWQGERDLFKVNKYEPLRSKKAKGLAAKEATCRQLLLFGLSLALCHTGSQSAIGSLDHLDTRIIAS